MSADTEGDGWGVTFHSHSSSTATALLTSARRHVRSLANRVQYRAEKEEKLWEITVVFAAADQDEADRLWDGLDVAFGCHGEGDDHVCPHFRFSALRPASPEAMEES